MMARVKLKLVSILGIIIILGLVNCGNALPAVHHRNSENDRLLTDFSDATVSESHALEQIKRGSAMIFIAHWVVKAANPFCKVLVALKKLKKLLSSWGRLV